MSMQDTLQALADPTRREMTSICLNSPKYLFGEISNHFSISGAAVSRTPVCLKEADLIRDEAGRANIFIMSLTLLCLRRFYYGLVN